MRSVDRHQPVETATRSDPSRLEWAARGTLTVRRERFPAGLGIEIVYVSDLHLAGNWTRRIVDETVQAIAREHPDLVLLGGDLIDRKSAMPLLDSLLMRLRSLGAVLLAIPGNHDQFVGEALVRAAVLRQDGHWLPDRSFNLPGLTIACPASMESSDAPDDSFQVICSHHPSVAESAVSDGFDLVLAGHLHGCQGVFWKRSGKLYPGAWFYRWNGPKFVMGKTTMLVSNGVNDTIPLRWNCPREIIVCSL